MLIIFKVKTTWTNLLAKNALMHAYSERSQSYWKLTGDTVIVLFASNIMDPLTAGSFLLILKQTDNTKYQILKFYVVKAKQGKTMQNFHRLVFHSSSCWVQDHPPLVPFPQLLSSHNKINSAIITSSVSEFPHRITRPSVYTNCSQLVSFL